MAEASVQNETELIQLLRKSSAYQKFKNTQLPLKIAREKRAWDLLQENRGRLTKEILNQIFDTVDFHENTKRWFGSLLGTPNRNLIFASGESRINGWFQELLFSNKQPEIALTTCLKDLRIKGASKGLATLLLYLSSSDEYSIWVDATQDGLSVLNRIGEIKGRDWGAKYAMFNKAALDFRASHGFQPQELDWVLTFIGLYVESDNNRFRINKDLLQIEDPLITIDEVDIDDIVGQPMELGVMRWTPTNEMGVVALFIEFRKELGFPLIEVIRTNFPDAAVFQEVPKGYARKYIEFEFRSSGYKAHLKSKRKCHYVVCWDNDWKACPIPVIELKQEVPIILTKRQNGMPNAPEIKQIEEPNTSFEQTGVERG